MRVVCADVDMAARCDAKVLITGDTGVGKTSSGLNKLLISLTERYPCWGGLILDPKGVYWKTVETLLQAAHPSFALSTLKVAGLIFPALILSDL